MGPRDAGAVKEGDKVGKELEERREESVERNVVNRQTAIVFRFVTAVLSWAGTFSIRGPEAGAST